MVSKLIIWKNGCFSNTENLHYKKAVDAVLLSLFIRTNGKCTNSYAPKHLLKQYSAFRQNPIFLKDQNMEKYQNYIDALDHYGKTYLNKVFL